MSFTIADLYTSVASKMHSVDINQLNDPLGTAVEAAGNVLNEMTPRGTRKKATLTNAIYDQVYNYVLPSDLNADDIIDIRPQTPRALNDALQPTSSKDFDRDHVGFTVEDNAGIRTVRIAGVGLTAGSTLNECDSLTANGTWAAGSNATTLSVDSLNKISGSASLLFNISAGGTTAYVENSTMTAVDMTNFVNTGAMFVWVYIPSITIITSINLRWGTTSANYYDRTVTVAHDTTTFVVGWNLLRFDWSGATQTGTPTNTSIKYSRVTFNYNGTATTSCRVDSVIVRLGAIYEILYHSKYLFQTTAGVWIEKPTLTTDVFNLAIDEFNVFSYEYFFLVAQELQKKDASFDVKFWADKKKETWDAYKAKNKSQVLLKKRNYYPNLTAARRRR